MRYLVFAAMLALAACGARETPSSGGTGAETEEAVAGEETSIAILAAWMRPHPAGRDVTAAYFTASLSEGTVDFLEAAEIEGAERAELHGHFMTADGVMQMRELGAQRVDADGPLVFMPGGRHLMVFGLPPVAEGETVRGTLTFRNAGSVPVTFEVRSMPPEPKIDY